MQPTDLSPALLPPLPWAAPFLGVLASIALIPTVAPRFWQRRLPWIAGFWTAALLLPWAAAMGGAAAANLAIHALLIEYLPFISLLLALYVAGGGVLLRGRIAGTPAANTALLAAGTVLAGVMGTTGASMVLIHPLLHGNAHRRRKVHLAAFFIILVSNAGGALSPLGDPPLYLGYLHGVPFLWPARHLGPPLAALALFLLALFYAVDRVLASGEALPAAAAAPAQAGAPAGAGGERFHIRGFHNLGLIAAAIGLVLMQGAFHATIRIGAEQVEAARLAASFGFLAIAGLSTLTTARAVRQGNDFSWHPIIEVAVLFVAVFVTIDPVLAMLAAGRAGPFAPVLSVLTGPGGEPLPAPFFWLTGTLSAFLDNAPTYLIFFGLAGGPDSQRALAALSAGAVFFGALTYIGNAPNLMVRAIAAHRGVRMPGFFAFSALVASILLPAFAVLTAIFFR